MRDNIRIVVPLIVLGYAPSKLFCVSDERGKGFIPIFTMAERAADYMAHFSTADRELHHYVMGSIKDASSVLQTIKIVDPTVDYVTLNPYPPTIEHATKSSVCMKISEAIERLVQDYSNGANVSSDS